MMHKRAALLIALALALLSASCSTPPRDSGIKDLVTIGPVSPVQREGEPSEAPYAATILVSRSSGKKVAEVTSGADGRFTVELRPGDYVIEPRSSTTPPTAPPQAVTVQPHRFTEIRIQFDSGIR